MNKNTKLITRIVCLVLAAAMVVSMAYILIATFLAA